MCGEFEIETVKAFDVTTGILSARPSSAEHMNETVSTHNSEDVELGAHIQEKENRDSHAGFTCDMCPQPKKPFFSSIGLIEPQKAWYRLDKPYGGMTFYPSGFHRLIFTKRCKTCNTKIRRWSRTQKLAQFVIDISELSEFVAIAFVTLTKPNTKIDIGDEEKLKTDLLEFKKKVSNFTRTKRMKENVAGGFNFFEQTTSSAGGVNSHCHGIWILNSYYDQAQLEKDWNGRVDIRKITRKYSAVKYATKYSSKEKLFDLRLKESFGVCRGSARTAIELELARMKEEQFGAQDVSESMENLELFELDNPHTQTF